MSRLIHNANFWWGVRIILADLYEWRRAVTGKHWRKIDDRIRGRADDHAWHHSILDRLKLRSTATEIALHEEGQDDDGLQYSLEYRVLAAASG